MSCCAACGTHGCACGCGARAGTPLPIYNRPGLDALAYRVGTWADFRATMQADLSNAALPALSGLRTRETDDPALALLDAWAVGADVLMFYQERIANEGFLRTATERRSVLELARLVDYRVRPGVAASVYLAFTVDDNSAPVTIPAGARAQSVPAPGEQMQTFETSDPIEARHEWNALSPRLSVPQDITAATVAGLRELWLAGTSSKLKPGDPLLFVFGDVAPGDAAVRQVQAVHPHPESGRTCVALQPTPAAAPALQTGGNAASMVGRIGVPKESTAPATRAQDLGLGGVIKALTQPLTLQPANPLRLVRDPAVALGVKSDARPQLLLNFEPGLATMFYRAWTSLAVGAPSPAPLTGVYAMRVAAPLFGYNAQLTMGLVPNPDTATQGAMPYLMQSDGDWPSAEKDDHLRLDNVYDGVLAGSYVIIQPGGAAASIIAQVQSVQAHPRTDYGISGKTSDITLANTIPGTTIWPAPPMSTVRSALVYAQSDSLTLADAPIADSVGATTDGVARTTSDDATHLALDGVLDGFKAGRWVIVAGQRTDVPGTSAVNAAERVMVSAVQQGPDPYVPGDTVHSTLLFADKGLAFVYRRGSVSIYANVAHATHGETRNEVLGNGNGAAAMQGFALKQKPLTFVSAPTVDGVQSTLVVRVNDVEWHAIENLAFAGPADRSFVTATANDGTTSVTFGDGAHGARLPTGTANVTAVYRNGIGTPGNVEAGQISLLATRPLGVKAVVNPLGASGGADPETRDQARANVPLAVLALDRLVSVPDYADFARSFGGVGKATAVKLGSLVQVTIAGAADAPVDATSDVFVNLAQALLQYGDPSLAVGLDVRELLTLTFSAKVGLQADYAWEAMEPQLRAALLDAFGFERRALAQSVYLSELVACIQAVRGVAWVEVDAFGAFSEQDILAGLGAGDADKGGGNERLVPADPGSVTLRSGQPAVGSLQFAHGKVKKRVIARPARFDQDDQLRPAQLACFVPDVPDTLLLQEATP